MGGACSKHGRYGKHYKIVVVNPERRDHVEDLDVDGKIILECILGYWGWKSWNGYIWITIGTSGRPLLLTC